MLRFSSSGVQITVRGGIDAGSLDRLRVSLKLERGGKSCSDRGDLYSGRRADEIARRAAGYLGAGEKEMREVISRLASALEAYRLRRVEAVGAPKEEARTLPEKEKQEALRYLKAPELLYRTNRDIGRSGIVGEGENRLLMYLAFTSRLRERPLQVMSLGKSGIGKTYLQQSVGLLIPEEERLEITSLSENALYYYGKEELRHKLLMIEDLDGAEGVMYALRELQSSGRLRRSVVLKDEKGRLKSETLEVEGPVCVAGCTTSERLYEDNANRCLIIELAGGTERQAAILNYQRARSAGEVDGVEQETLRRRFRNVQRMLRPVAVRNPYAKRLSLPPEVFRKQRANELYLSLIETITFYHQYQREVKAGAGGKRYIETTPEDIEAANRLIAGVLLAKSDELSGAARRFLTQLKDYLREEKKESFYAGEIRRRFRLHPATAGRYVRELGSYGLLEITGGDRYRRGYEYALTSYGREDSPEGSVRGYLAEVLQGLGD